MSTEVNPAAAGRPRADDEPAAAGEQFGPPELVIVPAHPVRGGDVEFETRQELPSRTIVLPVFSTVGRLVQTLGPAQPWVAMPLVSVRELAGSAGLREVRLDPSAAPGAWRWDDQDLARLEGSLR